MLRGKTQKLALWYLLYQEVTTTKQRDQFPSVGTGITIEKEGAKNIKGNVPTGKQNYEQLWCLALELHTFRTVVLPA